MERNIVRLGLVPLVLAVTFLAGACGESPKPQDAQAAPAGNTAADYVKCMRENGVPKFPDADANGQFDITPGQEGLDPDSATFKAAEEACKPFMQGGALDRETSLKYAKCMREHGVPKFPDPDKNGGFRMNGNDVGDPNSPAMQKAQQVCRDFQPGGPSAKQTMITQ
jgi:hypothetical protein